jgi:metal-responsive CopG/Arc/MetJ family transcriptional regulator
MPDKKHLAIISILVKERQKHAADMQRILTEAGHLIMARLGVNVQPLCVENCTGLVAIAVKGTANEISGLTKRLNDLYGIVAKACVMTE